MTDEEISRALSKDPKYPCNNCTKHKESDNCSGSKTCAKWHNWSGEEWKSIRKSFSRTGEIAETQPLKPVMARRNR